MRPFLPVKPSLQDSPQTAVAAGKEDPRFFLLLLFSFWLYRLHFPKGRPLHMVLGREEEGGEMRKCYNNPHSKRNMLFILFIHHISTFLFNYVLECVIACDNVSVRAWITWQCLGTWFSHKATGSDDLHLQCSFLVHHTNLNVTWITKNKKQLSSNYWLKNFSLYKYVYVSNLYIYIIYIFYSI